MSAKLLGVIVLYYPDLMVVKTLITELQQQNCDVVIVDNSPNSHAVEMNSVLKPNDEYVHFSQNIGLGKAHNLAAKKAITNNYDFLLIFDQDSAISLHFIDDLLMTFKIAATTHKIAAVGPSYTDHRFDNAKRKNIHVVRTHSPKKMIISSGSLFSVGALKDVGLMDEELFIDFIDTEWCYRASKMGYQVYQSASAIMEHHLGEMKPVLMGLYQMRYTSPIRYYYFTRNLKRLTLAKKISVLSSVSGYFKHLPLMILKAFFLKDTRVYLKNIIKGLKD